MRGGEEDDSFLTYLHGRHGGVARPAAVAPALRGRADLRERDRIVAGLSASELLDFVGMGGEPPFGVRGLAVSMVELLEHER